jgi:HSP20 family molecular chaperone IbpA
MFSMMEYPGALSNEPYRLVDHPHERPHQHQSFLASIAHRKVDPSHLPNRPDVDICDNLTSYEIDIEIPGVTDPDAIQIDWLSWKTLIVTGNTYRPIYVDGKLMWRPFTPAMAPANPDNITGTAAASNTSMEVLDNESMNVTTESLPAPAATSYLVVGERRVGYFRREFNFPERVEMNNLEATLKGGLLHLTIPKERHHAFPKGKAKVTLADQE